MNLEPNDYWKLRALNSDLERDQATLIAVQSRLETNKIKRQKMWEELVEKYKLDANGQYQANDADCSLSMNGSGT